MTFQIQYAGLSDRGRVRTLNEDRWAGLPDLGLFIVADGIGGQPAGNVAGTVVVEALPALVSVRFLGVEDLDQTPNAGERMRELLCELSNALRREGMEAGMPGLGSTVVAVLVRGESALVAHMGDSRAYLLRDSQFRPLTRDHTLHALLAELGNAQPDPGNARSRLTRYVGMKSEPLPDCQMQKLRSGDVILLCTDGLTDMLAEAELERLLRDCGAPDETCARLVQAANEAGGRDNICVVVLKVGSDGIVSPGDSAALREAAGHGG